MKVFVVHSNSDNAEIDVILKKLITECRDLELLSLTGNQKKWKLEAKKKIKNSDCAVFFVGKESHKSPWIDWELKKFIKMNKRVYTYKLGEDNKYNECLYRKDTFGNIEKSKNLISSEVSFNRLVSICNEASDINISEELGLNDNISIDLLMEQYKIYLQTSEDLVLRRQNISNFYITINSALVSLTGIIVPLINQNVDNSKIITVALCVGIAIIGMALSFSWNRTITSYGQLNSAKMKVIAAIEKFLPANLYDTEWKVQTDKLGKKRYRSFTSIEKTIPKLFFILYFIILIISIIWNFI